MSFSFNKGVTKTHSFEQSYGIEVGIEIEVECKIPFIGGGTVKPSLKTSTSWTYGSQNEESESF